MHALLATWIRTLALVGKEIIETLRRPGALVSLVLGPFLILALFGIGYDGVKRPLDTLVVIPPSSGLSTDPATYQALAGGGLNVVGVTGSEADAETRLRDGSIDVVVIAPEDPQATFQAGQQSVMRVQVDTVDPIALDYANYLANAMSDAVNRSVIEQAASKTEGYAVDNGGSRTPIPPKVVASPTRAELQNAAPTTPGFLRYFAPAVVALILQHLAISLVALSLVRERTSGVMELFRIAPVSSGEILSGKVLAFGLIGAGVAALTFGLLIAGLGVPDLADQGLLIATIALLLLASLGIGLVVAMLSDSERQAVQLSLLLLLASVFFSGFVLSIDQFTPVIRGLANLLPVTQGIRLLQDLMLRGTTNEPWRFAILAAIGVVTLFTSWALLRRNLARA